MHHQVMNLFQLTRDLIDIPSVTGSEAQLSDFLASYLSDLGYQVERQPVAGDRANVIAHTGATAKVVFSTHLDTVPPHIISSEDAEHIYGRGSCDAKGIIAAQIFAAEQLRAGGNDEIGFLFTVDEELASAGAQIANNHPLARDCRYLINGEPTDNRLAIGTKGSLRFTLTTTGRAAHSAYPEHGESAIEELLDVLEALRRVEWPRDDVLGETTCNIGVISGGTKPNVVPAAAAAEVQLRLVTDVEPIKEIISATVAGRAQVNYASEHGPVKLMAVEELEQTLVRFTTDIPYLSHWGTPLLLGPGSILDAHTDHERIAKAELSRAVDLYVRLARLLVESAVETKAANLRQ
ncbi:MAG TPA: M20/M25/M40 family metallo-hydrolase [Pyrinomonadaceae bacterium]|nr:M20/M25/M40 family metallo-hydrolase [Pyrinomonadaceae bacterium]